MVEAISPGSLMRFRGIIPTAASRIASDLRIWLAKRVSVSPGATALTRMPRWLYVEAAVRTIDSMPPFAAAMASWLTRPREAATLEVNTNRPPPLRSMVLQAVESVRKALERFVWMTSLNASSFTACGGRMSKDPTK